MSAARDLRQEVQALRALAVALVVLMHFWPAAVPGGFVGVDVFFVISGFLITGLLLREHDRDGRIGFLAFWARRARRLLPAALLVVAVCVAGTLAFVPLTQWDAFLSEMRASVLYFENWHLAADAVDYFAADDGPSPVQHYWTLSVEEQFYLAWPLLVGAALWVGATLPGRRGKGGRGTVAVLLAALTAASLAYGIHLTQTNPAVAYFSTPARAWEFAAGGLLALLPAAKASRPRLRAAASWAGLAAIGAAAFLYGPSTDFPGWTALLPVAGALAVIRAGMPPGLLSPARLFALAPVQRLGLLSYSVYLWHWPLLVLAPFALDREVSGTLSVALVALTLVLSEVSLRLVEEPLRSGPLLRSRRPALTYALVAPAMALVVLATFAAEERRETRIAQDARQSAQTLAAPPECFGATARDPKSDCEGQAELAGTVVPTPLQAQDAPNAPCEVINRTGRHVSVCAFGVRDPQQRRATVALVGDSHAASWRAALAPVARARKWRGLSITRSGCPFTTATRDVDEPARSRCVRWNREVLAWFEKHPEVKTVFVVSRAGIDVETQDGEDSRDVAVRGYAEAWRKLPDSVRRVVVVRDQPRLRGDTVDCVAEAVEEDAVAAKECAVPRETALLADPKVAAAERVRRARVVDLTRSFCGAKRCFPVVGGALAYRDESHLTATFAATLAPQLGRAITRITGREPVREIHLRTRAQRRASPSVRSQSPSVDRTA